MPPVEQVGSGARLDNAGRLDCILGSRASSAAAPDSNLTKSKKSKATREDFCHSVAKLTQVQSRLAQENNELAPWVQMMRDG